MKRETVFIGLGGNIGDSVKTINSALSKIEQVPQIFELKCSNFYKTSPVSQIPQSDYVNAVCSFNTTLGAKNLLLKLQRIESELGKVAKPKDAPRIIDLDILFFGDHAISNKTLVIPHPKWQNRLFVLVPLLDLVKTIKLPQNVVDIKDLINKLKKENNEKVERL